MTENSRIRSGITSSRGAVIEALLEFGPLSRSHLADLLQVSRSALTELSHDLLQMGLLHEMPVAHNKRKGRPSVLLSLRAEHGYFVGVSITDTPALMVLADLHGNLVSQYEIAAHNKPQALADSIGRGLPQLLSAKKISVDRVLGIGIGLSGFADHTKGICLYSAALNWHDVPIAEIVRRSTGILTHIDNDANAVATGEKLFGKARELKNFSILTLSATIGSGHYIEGRLYHGHAGGAGEIGHITIVPDGQQCRCGKRGCLDTIAASSAILSEAKAQKIPAKTIPELETLAANGNSHAITILRNAGRALGLAVANLIQINNPELVLFADIEGFGNGVFITAARQTVENNILPRFLSSTRLLFHQVDQSFLARGAASIAAHQLLLEQADLPFSSGAGVHSTPDGVRSI